MYKMNLAFYLSKISDEYIELFKMLNDAMLKYPSSTFSVFYDDLDHVSIPTNFAMFNATELWSFTGVLVCLNAEHTTKALNVINKFKLLHMYNSNVEQSLFGILSLVSNEAVGLLTNSEKDSKELYRLTGKKPKQIENFCVEEILEVI